MNRARSEPWTQAWVPLSFWGGGNSIQKSSIYCQHKRLWYFQFSSMEMEATPLCLIQIYPRPHAILGSQNSPNTCHFLSYLCRTLFLWGIPHVHRNLQAAKPRFRRKVLEGRRGLSTPSPLSLWCFSEVGLPRRTLKRKRKGKMSLGRAVPHCPGPQKACFVPKRAC